MKNVRAKLIVILAATLVGLLVLHLIFLTAQTDCDDYWELVELFNMDSEISLFTWFSTTILLFVPAVLLLYIGWKKRRAGEKLSWSWFVLGGVFLFLSMDDGAMIHEKVSTINRLTGLQDILNDINPYLFGWSWWVVYTPFVIALVFVMLRWFMSVPTRTKVLVAIAFFLAVIGQEGMEIISGMVATSSDGEYVSMVWRGFQKFIGRSGLALFLFALVDYILVNKEKLLPRAIFNKS